MQKKEIFGCVHTDNHQMILCIFWGQILVLEIEKRNTKVSLKSSKVFNFLKKIHFVLKLTFLLCNRSICAFLTCTFNIIIVIPIICNSRWVTTWWPSWWRCGEKEICKWVGGSTSGQWWEPSCSVPCVWPPSWWSPGVWPTSCWSPGVWPPSWWSPGIRPPGCSLSIRPPSCSLSIRPPSCSLGIRPPSCSPIRPPSCWSLCWWQGCKCCCWSLCWWQGYKCGCWFCWEI